MEESLYDKLAYVASVNLFTKKKENEDICFDMSNISFNDKSFWFLEQFAANMRPILKIKKIYVSANFFRFLKYRITKQHHILHFSFKKRKTIDVYDFLKHISDANEVDYKIWEDMYNEYYAN